MSTQDDDQFRVRAGTPKQRGDAFINKVLRQTIEDALSNYPPAP